MHCPFCNSNETFPVSNSQGLHWRYCTTCKASGPHKATPEEADTAWHEITPPRRPGVLDRLRRRADGTA